MVGVGEKGRRFFFFEGPFLLFVAENFAIWRWQIVLEMREAPKVYKIGSPTKEGGIEIKILGQITAERNNQREKLADAATRKLQ